MGNRRGYSDEDKAFALAYLQAHGGNVYRAAKDLGIHPQNLYQWSHGLRISEQARLMSKQKVEELKQQLTSLAETSLAAAMDRIQNGNVQALVVPQGGGMSAVELVKVPVPFKDLTVGLGITIEKLQLLSGKPTEISQQSVEIVDDTERQRRAQAILDELSLEQGLIPGDDGTVELSGLRRPGEPEVPMD